MAHLSIFDLLSINLYHGWVIDPNDQEFYQYLKDLSYNQLVEKAIGVVSPQSSTNGVDNNNNSSNHRQSLTSSGKFKRNSIKDKEMIISLVAEKFLAVTASQLTYYGLVQLHELVKERELCIFFRNNHFSTMFKLKGQLYCLVTDQGYLGNDAIAWEHLTAVDGDTEFVSPEFGSPGSYRSNRYSGVSNNHGGVIDPDLALAMQLQMEEDGNRSISERDKPLPPPKNKNDKYLPVMNQPMDPVQQQMMIERQIKLERIQRLQQEQQRKSLAPTQIQQQPQQQQQQTQGQQQQKKKKFGCIVL